MSYPGVIFFSCGLLNSPMQFSSIHQSSWNMFAAIKRRLSSKKIFLHAYNLERVFLYFSHCHLGWMGYNIFSSVRSYASSCLRSLQLKSQFGEKHLSHPLPSFPMKIDTLKGMKYNAKCCLRKECLKFLRDNVLFQNKAISGNSILICTKLFIWETFFSSTNILALGFYLSERKKKVFWKISFILLQSKIKQTKPDSEEVQSICHSCCPCLVKDSTIPLELLLHTLFIWQPLFFLFLVFYLVKFLPRMLCHA